ncbi:hypothetical protein BLOT_001650 [Blomia tropicalis]|nr:hypothetical protein BLOT_001650 [Blomia tropicalis]
MRIRCNVRRNIKIGVTYGNGDCKLPTDNAAGMEPVINLAMNMRERKREIGEERPMIDPKTENLVGNWSSGEVLKISTSIHHSKMAAFFTKVWVK